MKGSVWLTVVWLLQLVSMTESSWKHHSLELHTLGGTRWTDMSIRDTVVVVTARTDRSLLFVLDVSNINDMRFGYQSQDTEVEYDLIATYKTNSEVIAIITRPNKGTHDWAIFNTSNPNVVTPFGINRFGKPLTITTFLVTTKDGSFPWVIWATSNGCVAEILTKERNLSLVPDMRGKQSPPTGLVAVMNQKNMILIAYSVFDKARKRHAIHISTADGYYSDSSHSPKLIDVTQTELINEPKYLFWDSESNHLYILSSRDSSSIDVRVLLVSVERKSTQADLTLSGLDVIVEEISDTWLLINVQYTPVVVFPLVIATSGITGIYLINLTTVGSGRDIPVSSDDVNLHPLCPSLGGPMQVVTTSTNSSLKRLFALCSHANTAKLLGIDINVDSVPSPESKSIPPSGNTDNNIIIAIVIVVGILLLVIIVLIMFFVFRKKVSGPHSILGSDRMLSLSNTEGSLRFIPHSSFGTLDKIAEGNSGCVFKSFYAATGEFVALKASKKIVIDESFFSEITLLCSLRQKDIIMLYGWSEIESKPHMVTEYCSCGSLASYNHPSGRDETVLSLVSITRALSYLHDRGFAHLDVAARNILITESHTLKLGDMGLVTKLNERTNKPLAVAWSPPESLVNRIATTKHDSWSFGCLIYEVMTGENPFYEVEGKGRKRLSILTKMIQSKSVPNKPLLLSELNEIIWTDIVEKCWSFDTDNRPSMQMIMSTLLQLSDKPPQVNNSSLPSISPLQYQYAVSTTGMESYETAVTRSQQRNPIIPPRSRSPSDTLNNVYSSSVEYQFPFVE